MYNKWYSDTTSGSSKIHNSIHSSEYLTLLWADVNPFHLDLDIWNLSLRWVPSMCSSFQTVLKTFRRPQTNSHSAERKLEEGVRRKGGASFIKGSVAVTTSSRHFVTRSYDWGIVVVIAQDRGRAFC